ncbi:MAG: hypothetical protein DRI90_06930 [Deltaproteobacteria bacterium]|nr:MAG: hypothetical protein DRI90_06930 [Deltaproteobacteria bacterium]
MSRYSFSLISFVFWAAIALVACSPYNLASRDGTTKGFSTPQEALAHHQRELDAVLEAVTVREKMGGSLLVQVPQLGALTRAPFHTNSAGEEIDPGQREFIIGIWTNNIEAAHEALKKSALFDQVAMAKADGANVTQYTHVLRFEGPKRLLINVATDQQVDVAVMGPLKHFVDRVAATLKRTQTQAPAP